MFRRMIRSGFSIIIIIFFGYTIPRIQIKLVDENVALISLCARCRSQFEQICYADENYYIVNNTYIRW